MKIDWAALGTVAIVSVVVSVVFVALLAGGIRSVSAARIKRNQGTSGTGVLSAGYAMLGLAGVLVLFGLYLIVPQFH
jgi:hypothetical protein